MRQVMCDAIVSPEHYAHTLETIRRLKVDLLQLAQEKGNLDPSVIALSQAIDRYIVQVQRYQLDPRFSEVG